MALAASMDIYQLKINIDGCFGVPLDSAPIWRRIQISKNATFEELHYAILNCIGWEDSHLHVFKAPYPKLCAKKRIYVTTISNRGVDDWEGDKLDESDIKLCDYFFIPGDIIVYKYDLNNVWSRKVVLEEIMPSISEKDYPVCIAGERACPPPGCKGVGHYNGFVKVASNPGVEYEKDSFLDECKQWLADDGMEDWNPEFFDPKSVVFTIPPPDQRLY